MLLETNTPVLTPIIQAVVPEDSNAHVSKWLSHGTTPVLNKIEIPEDARVFVGGDLHGERARLIMRLVELGFDFKKDVFVCTGDLINKGADSLNTLRLLNERWFFSVRGNHEELALDTLILKCPWKLQEWHKRGGEWFGRLKGVDKHEAEELILERVSKLPLAIELNVRGKRFGITHGDYNANEWSLDQLSRTQLLNGLTTDRTLANQVLRKKGKSLPSVAGLDGIYHGHTSFKHYASAGNRHWIDTKGHATGNLTVIELAPTLN